MGDTEKGVGRGKGPWTEKGKQASQQASIDAHGVLLEELAVAVGELQDQVDEILGRLEGMPEG